MEPPDAQHMHHRLLQLLDGLHRIGFEQLRFDRSWEDQHMRLQVYPACLSQSDAGIQFEIPEQFTLSDTMVYPWGMCDLPSGLDQQWVELLAGDMAPNHLVGRWVMDFPNFARQGFGPDHPYREWFRRMRTPLTEGYLPVTWAEQYQGTDGIDFTRFVEMWHPQLPSRFIERPPANTHYRNPWLL